MNIYKISHEELQYDAFMGHVIVANNEQEVRAIAKKAAADEGREVWDTAKVKRIGTNEAKAKPFIVLSNFRAG